MALRGDGQAAGMNATVNRVPGNESFVWIQTLINGVSGVTMRVKGPLFSAASPFQKIEVYDTYAFGKVLCLAGCVVFTEKDEYVYNEMIVHPAMIMHPAPKRVCIIGGGDGGSLREVLRHKDVEAVRIVEIDAKVKETVETYFPEMASAFADPRATLTVADGADYLAAHTELYDCIIVDSLDPGGPVESLETSDFYRQVSQRLTPGGVAIFQTGYPAIQSELFRSMVSNARSAFPFCAPYLCTIPSFPEGLCAFLLCTASDTRQKNIDPKRLQDISAQCQYYNTDIQTGAFLLPQDIKRLVG